MACFQPWGRIEAGLVKWCRTSHSLSHCDGLKMKVMKTQSRSPIIINQTIIFSETKYIRPLSKATDRQKTQLGLSENPPPAEGDQLETRNKVLLDGGDLEICMYCRNGQNLGRKKLLGLTGKDYGKWMLGFYAKGLLKILSSCRLTHLKYKSTLAFILLAYSFHHRRSSTPTRLKAAPYPPSPFVTPSIIPNIPSWSQSPGDTIDRRTVRRNT